MEYILENTDIFDNVLEEKFGKLIFEDIISYCNEDAYSLTVSFHVSLLSDSRFEGFDIPVPSKTSKGTRQDKIYDVLSYQLRKLEQRLNENCIYICSSTIQGAQLNNVNIIKVEVKRDISEPRYTGRGKNKKRMKISSIIPSLPYTQELVSKFAAERLGKMYWELMKIIRSKKIMAEILEIEATEDDNDLIKAFVNQYGGLWLTTKEKEKALLDRLMERCLVVLNKHIEINESHEVL